MAFRYEAIILKEYSSFRKKPCVRCVLLVCKNTMHIHNLLLTYNFSIFECELYVKSAAT